MQSYRYLCIDDLGERREGTLEVSSSRRAKEELIARGWSILLLDEEDDLLGEDSSSVRLSGDEKCRFLDKFATLFDSGITITESLEAAVRNERREMEAWGVGVARLISEGTSLSEALNRNRAGLSASTVAVIRIGERSGRLVSALRQLALNERQKLEQFLALKARLTYPLVQAVILGLLCLLLGCFLGPELTSLVKGLGGEQPLLTSLVLRLLSGPVVGTFAVILFLGGFSLYLFWTSPAGRHFLDEVTPGMPVLGPIYSEIALVRFCRDLGLLLDCGFDWQRSLKLCLTGSNSFDEGTDHFRDNLNSVAFEDAVEQNGNFPRLLKALLITGYEAQKIPQFLELYASMLEESLSRRVELAVALVEPLLLVTVGSMVGLVVVASFLPILSLVHQI